MKAPSAVDIGVVLVILSGVQVFLSSLPADKVTEWWWAPALSAALLAVIKGVQVAFFPEGHRPVDPAAPGAAAQMSVLPEPPSKLRQFLTD